MHTLSLPEVLTLTVDQALSALAHLKKVWDKMQILHDLDGPLGQRTPRFLHEISSYKRLGSC